MPQRRLPKLVSLGASGKDVGRSAHPYCAPRVLFRSMPGGVRTATKEGEDRQCVGHIRERTPSPSGCDVAPAPVPRWTRGGLESMSQGHIRQQGKGSWELKFDLGRDPLTGKRITKYATFRGTKRKARDELTRLLAQRNEGSYVDPTKMTMAQYLHHWLEVDVDRRVAARTAARYRGIVEKNITPKLGHVPV